MNSVWATTQPAVYVAMKHIFPRGPDQRRLLRASAIKPPHGTFSRMPSTRGPWPGCAAEVAQRIMEAVFGAMAQPLPDRLFGAPAGTSGNLALGGHDPEAERDYIMYFFSGGGYGAGLTGTA
ncbi:MAG: hypothetical protein Ct9H300mP16_15450 [Pseudomonadota bacterium]|nr:MAG: hypothetical protein Ct9H300mP16_15450 [Pseudomonadota bacterium]